MSKIQSVIVSTILITSFIGIFSIHTSVADPIHYVDSGENIQAAITLADPGDTIYVYHGTYVEQINVTKSLIIEGESKSNTTINGGFYVTADDVTIQHFSITGGYTWDTDGAGVNGTHRAGIRTNSSNYLFYDNDIYDIFGGNGDNDDNVGGNGGNGIGIFIDASTGGDVSQNTIYSVHGGNGGGGLGTSGLGGNCSGIYLSASTGIDITQNTIDDLLGGNGGTADPGGNGGTGVGIFLESTTTTNIIKNTVTGTIGGTGGDADHGGAGGMSAGIYLKTSSDINISQNTIDDLTGGTGGTSGEFGGDGNLSIGIYLRTSPDNIITNTNISHLVNGTGGVGLTADGADRMGIGFYGNDSESNTIAHCRITFGYTGIVWHTSSSNLCYNNYFSNNSYNAFDNGTNEWNISETSGTNIIGGAYLGGNSWSNYTGVDNDLDGFGDTAYTIPGGANQDELPLMNQPPNIPNSPTPENDSTGVPVDDDLSWSGGDPDGDAVEYDVYFGTANPPPKVTSNQSGTSYTLATMNHDTMYYWRIVAWDSNDATTKGPLWNFTTIQNNPPTTPNSPDPANGSTIIPLTAGLNWSGGDPDDDAVEYDVYFGTANPPPKVSGNETDASYNPGPMDYSTTYYWKIISWDVHDASTIGPIWNFTTLALTGNPPIFSSPNPANKSTDRPLSLSSVSIKINDTDGDPLNWTITTTPKIGNSSGTYAVNGTKTCNFTGSLAYSTTYWWTVTAYDGSGWNNKTYWFSTVSDTSGPSYPGGDDDDQPPDSQNIPPVASASFEGPYQGLVNTEIIFDGSHSDDPDGNITDWLWNFGDATNGTGITVGHSFSHVGTYTITLTVEDEDGAIDSDSTTCLVKHQNRPPAKPMVSGPTTGTKNTVYNYTVVSTDQDNDTLRYSFIWGDQTSYQNSSTYLPSGVSFTYGHSWTVAGRYILTVTVSDHQEEIPTNITVYIDAVQTRGTGYLLDYDGDGIYDAFYSEESQQTISTIQKKDDTYLIDDDGDGEWDYMYNATNGITSYQKPRKTPGFELAFVIIALAWVLYVRRYRKL